MEEDAFGGPCYRNEEIVILSVQVSTKVPGEQKENKKAKKDDKAKKEDKAAKKEAAPKASWKNVEDSQPFVQSHVRPMFYYLCLQAPPAGVVFL